ncbi:IPT/TIG domain-containing protein [candidate division KSB1 bacterium]|nr:IPT/TIG domain-containing protein [candidate division KSB1 bacterium]
MKINQLILNGVLMSVLFIIMAGCEYDVKSPLWYEEYTDPLKPEIIGVSPADRAGPGVNYITILGKNFASSQDKNVVYFNTTTVDVTHSTTTSITVRRPNLVSDSAEIKVVSSEAIVVTNYKPYKIDPVTAAYGEFSGGERHSALAVDKDENLYVFQRTPRTVFKIPPAGERIEIGEASRTVTDAKMGPNGKLIMLMNNRNIQQMDPSTGEETLWIAANKKVSYGDFDSNGNFYTGGLRTDLSVITPAGSDNTIDVYASFAILCVRVYNGFVYLLVENPRPDGINPDLAIWKHEILETNGTLGEAQLVLDWADTGDYAEFEPKYFTFSMDGIMYIGTDHASPILILNPDGSQDILYKDILSTSAEFLVWGTGNYLYQIMGGEAWDLKRIDMGAVGATYYGRNM